MAGPETIGRLMELSRLVMSERALARAYVRSSLKLGPVARAIAAAHRAHAELLEQRLLALGGQRPEENAAIDQPPPDDLWISSRDPDPVARLRTGEMTSMRVYQDHLLDFDVTTASLVRLQVLPDHSAALDTLEDVLDDEKAEEERREDRRLYYPPR
jgi:hypothetical protein